jgi:hypothetical protein
MSVTLRPRVFLSASVPLPLRNAVYFVTADIIAIRDAVRALTMVITEEKLQLVFGGHPAISPMIRLQILQTGSPVGDRVIMYQSRYFDRVFPEDNMAFEHVELIDAVPGDREASLASMRTAMLGQPFRVGIFIGGMEGVEDEYAMFRRLHPAVPAFPVASTGAAARKLFDADTELQRQHPELRDEISYLSLMRSLVNVETGETVIYQQLADRPLERTSVRAGGKYLLALDQGTTRSRALVIDHSGKVIASAQEEFTQFFPQPGWVEHDPDEIWTATLETLAEVRSNLADAGQSIAAIGITNQRETAVVWDRRTGRPLHRAIVW